MASTIFTVEQVAPGVTCERSTDGQIIIFGVHDGSSQTIVRWAEQVKIALLNWPACRPCYMLQDLHHSSLNAFNEIMQSKLSDLFLLRPDLERWVAVILPDEDSARFAQLDVRVCELMVAASYPVHREIFTDRRQAMRWLLRNGANQ